MAIYDLVDSIQTVLTLEVCTHPGLVFQRGKIMLLSFNSTLARAFNTPMECRQKRV